MKVKKSRSLHPEECGVWLDTAELKRRPQQKMLPYTSKRFNPISRRKSTDSFLFDFTQTRTLLTCTKQTSMYSFFMPPGKKKMKPQIDHYEQSTNNKEPPVLDFALGENLMLCNNSESSQYMKSLHNEDECTFSENCDGEDIGNQSQSEQVKISCARKKGSPSQINLCDTPLFFSAHKDLQNMHLLQGGLQSCAANKKDYCLVAEFPVSFQCLDHDSSKEIDDSSHSLQASHLFTEDSQGYRVINHNPVKAKQKKCHSVLPLQDKTNFTGPARVFQSLGEKDSKQIMFTQDSEGNLVMKHNFF
ncbi:uncharacterized protein LOC134590675 isoform X1 [Pelobates fuscus]|uniref:uncharacterized protein LOC134590675 isoform X1 n=2 Tax=Pelobates fuscus TaxID=191477 RepID=UPI002FE47E2F